jgi:hypothetical protein
MNYGFSPCSSSRLLGRSAAMSGTVVKNYHELFVFFVTIEQQCPFYVNICLSTSFSARVKPSSRAESAGIVENPGQA